MEVNKDKATVVLISFVGAANSPSGSMISFQGIKAPSQFATKINKNNVPTYGTQGRYSVSPICSLEMLETYSNTASTKFCNPLGSCLRFLVPTRTRPKIIAITHQVTSKTCPCRETPPSFHTKCVPTSTFAKEKKT